MNIQSLTISYPPLRHIGSEIYTHRLNVALSAVHGVRATTHSVKNNPGFEGVRVSPFGWSETDWADLYLCHTDFAGPVLGLGRPVVGICHNTESAVLVSVHVNRFDLVVCNSDHMRETLAARDAQNYMVVHPPAPPVGEMSTGDRVTVVNLNENKVGQFWDIARALPEQRFLAVLGGYEEQIVPAEVPVNVEVIGHVPQSEMWERVWSRTRLLLAPSARESWNMTAGEALAHGIRTVSTDLPGVRENLGDTATYLDRDDLEAWVCAVTDSLRPDVYAQARAQFNHDRYTADLALFVEAVSTLGNSDSQAA